MVGPAEFPEMVESVRVPKNCPCEYRKMAEFLGEKLQRSMVKIR